MWFSGYMVDFAYALNEQTQRPMRCTWPSKSAYTIVYCEHMHINQMRKLPRVPGLAAGMEDGLMAHGPVETILLDTATESSDRNAFLHCTPTDANIRGECVYDDEVAVLAERTSETVMEGRRR